jgi:hypothetical protein
MEPSGRNWSQPVAKAPASEPAKRAKSVAIGCHRLPIGSHGKEGVDGSSPSEGSAKAAQSRFFCRSNLHELQNAMGMQPFMELPEIDPGRVGAPPPRIPN